MASKSDRPHPLAEARKETNKQLISTQRQQVAIERVKKWETLHSASEQNPDLIKNHRMKSRATTKELIVGDHVYTNTPSQASMSTLANWQYTSKK